MQCDSVVALIFFRIPSDVVHFVLVLLLELAFRLQPVVQVTTVNSATLDVNLKRSLTDFCQSWPIVRLSSATFNRRMLLDMV